MDDESMLDQALLLLVKVANASEEGTGWGLTLTVSGILISGDLIANTRWLREVEEQTVGAAERALGRVPDDGETGVSKLFSHFAEVLERQNKTIRTVRESLPDVAEDLEDLLGGQTAYIHLRNAKIYNANGSVIPTAGMHWRGRLSSVDGWTFGSLGTGEGSR